MDLKYTGNNKIAFRDELFYLSNFYPINFTYNKIVFKSSEHFFMTSKTFDKKEQFRIISAKTAKEAKALGKKVKLRPDWEEVKYKIMYCALYLKFTQNGNIFKKLIKTDDMYLEETNVWHDVEFGNCYCNECQGTGKNVLGKLLMILRHNLKNI